MIPDLRQVLLPTRGALAVVFSRAAGEALGGSQLCRLGKDSLSGYSPSVPPLGNKTNLLLIQHIFMTTH